PRGGRQHVPLVIARAEHLLVSLVVPVLEPAHQPAPDAVLKRDGGGPERDLVVEPGARALRVLEVFLAHGHAEAVGDVVGGPEPPAPPGSVAIPARAVRHLGALARLLASGDLAGQRELLDPGIDR